MSEIIAGTGHRPDKLIGHEPQIQLLTYDYLVEQKPVEVISGMADGFDTLLALAALELDIPLTCAVPFRSHHSYVDNDVYMFILTHAARVVYIDEILPQARLNTGWLFQRRNIWMVDNSTKLATCWDGSSGGTANCVGYARKVGRRMDRIWGTDPNVEI